MKRKLSTVFITAVLGIILISGGTFAYFSDTEEATGEFTSGTIDLSLNEDILVELEDLKPGDEIIRNFQLINSGSLDIDTVHLLSDYEVIDQDGNNAGEDFGDHIQVTILRNFEKMSEVVKNIPLSELKQMTPDIVESHNPFIGDGLGTGTKNTLVLSFKFVDNDEDQNIFQGDSLQLELNFEAMQTAGEAK